MGLDYLDGVLRGAAGALFLMLSWRFARDWRRSRAARFGAAVTLGGACYTALIAFDSMNGIGFTNPWRLPMHMLSLATPGLFWLFAASWFDDEFELRWWHWAFVAATVVSGVTANYLYWVVHLRPLALAYVWRAFSIVAVGMALRATARGWSGDLVESRRRVRVTIAIAVSVAIAWIVMSELTSGGWPPPGAWRLGNAAVMFVLAAAVSLATLGWRDPALLAAPVRVGNAPPRPDSGEDGPLLARLDTDMRHERLYRQDGLTITAVAARLGVPEYRLRRAINQGLGARNFNAYLNAFRIGEAADALADASQREVPILTIAMDAGFGSLAPFNRAFRDVHGCTPTEYRARASAP
jgi:AraC-like DNA-binding protein